MSQSKIKRDVLVIGASLGGMEALKILFGALPQDFPAAIFVVWHVAPESPNLLPDILQRVCAFPVVSPGDRENIQPGRAYIARPNFHLVVEESPAGENENAEPVIRLTHSPKENRFRPSIDVLFRSAAMAFGPRAIGVILTGALDDGASGLYAIKSRGGLAVVQDPLDAECPNMPISAMRAVTVDHTAPIAEMGALLTKLIHEPVQREKSAMNEKSVPGGMSTEIRIALEGQVKEEEVFALGEVSHFTCPECHGVLTQISEGKLTRYRCHTGHAFSLNALLVEVTRSSETALWNALRTLQETEMVAGHIAKHLREAGEDEIAENFLQQMVRAMRQANLVRQATLQNEVLSQDKLGI